MTKCNFFWAVVAGLAASLIFSGITFILTRNHYLETWVKVIDSAPEQYVQELDKLLTVEKKSSGTLASARALVGTRNDIVSSLESLSHLINSDFTRLDSEIKIAELAEDKYQEFSKSLNPKTGKNEFEKILTEFSLHKMLN